MAPSSSLSSWVLLLAALLTPTAALAQNSRGAAVAATRGDASFRTALVVGNSAYADSPLANPVNDAQDMATQLEKVGFEVTMLLDASHEEMAEAVRQFGVDLRRGGTGLFYYAGHGVQSEGANYLIPVDAILADENRLRWETLDVNEVLGEMDSAQNAFNIVILDACRNNPFARSFRSTTRGLAQMDAPTGTFIAYATAPGQVASDGAGRNGLYTQELLRQLDQGGLSINEVFDRVRVSVFNASEGRQVPWVSTSLMGSFHFQDANGKVPEPIALIERPTSPRAQPAAAAGALVLVYGEETGARSAETTILRSMIRREEVTALDATALSLVRADDAAVQAAMDGNFAALAELGRQHGVEFLVLGSLEADAQPGVGRFYTGTASLDVKLYRVSTGALVDADVFRIGGSTPGKMGSSAAMARSLATEAVGEAAARAIARWVANSF